MSLLLLLALAGPAETIAGKYVRHSSEYLEARPATPPAGPLPAGVDALCRRIEAGDDSAAAFAALGEALLADGRKALAYRAFHKAHRKRPQDTAWGQGMMERKRVCQRVPDPVIRAEEREAETWVAALHAFERARLATGGDPDDRTEFYERYGRASDDLWGHVRARRLSLVGGFVGVLVGGAFALASGRLRRAAAALPLAVAIGCAVGPAATGQTGFFWWGGAFALAGAAVVFGRGRR